MSKPNTLKIDDVEYVRKDSIRDNAPANDLDGMKYVVVRSRDSGCHAGYLKERNGDEVTLINSRRLWMWQGAATLSQLAMEGVSKPSACKFPCEVDEIIITGCCEVISARAKAQSSIKEVAIWKS